MKLTRALLCPELDCQEVFEANGPVQCPSCGAKNAFPLSRAMNTPTPREVEIMTTRTIRPWIRAAS